MAREKGHVKPAAPPVVEPPKPPQKVTMRLVFQPDGETQKKLFDVPRQMRQLLQILEDAGEAGLTPAELLERAVPVVHTKQGLDRILAYYKRRMIDEMGVHEVYDKN